MTDKAPHRFQFHRRKLFYVVAILGIILAAGIAFIAPGERQRWDVMRINRLGGEVTYAKRPQVEHWAMLYVRMYVPRDYLETVESVDVSGPQFQDADMRIVRHFPNLQRLTLCNSGVTDVGMRELQKHTALLRLDLPGSNITDAAIDSLETIPKLETLDVRNTQITRARLLALQMARPKCGWIHRQDSALQSFLDQKYGSNQPKK